MTTALTPAPAGSRPLIESYGGGGFRVAGQRFDGSILVMPGGVSRWEVVAASAVDVAALAAVAEAEVRVELLLVGCGGSFVAAPAALGPALRARGIGLEWMTTGAACRTFNVLLGDDRAVAAALIAVE